MDLAIVRDASVRVPSIQVLCCQINLRLARCKRAHGRIAGMDVSWAPVLGVLVKGYGVTSGPSQDYPYGALERQLPIFRQRGLDLGDYFAGTLNIDIRPVTFELTRPEYTFRDVRWTDLHPPEDFSLSRCRVAFRGVEYDGWIYYPHPETKRRNFQDPSLLEVITHRLADIHPGDVLSVMINTERVLLARPV